MYPIIFILFDDPDWQGGVEQTKKLSSFGKGTAR